MVDADRVRRLLGVLEDYRSRLEELGALSAEAYAEARFEARYLVQASAQICIDVANHLISSEGWRVPADLRDAFTVLQEHAVLEPDLADRLRALAGLRNRLVHLYTEVDDERVRAAINEGLSDLDRFATDVARFVAA